MQYLYAIYTGPEREREPRMLRSVGEMTLPALAFLGPHPTDLLPSVL